MRRYRALIRVPHGSLLLSAALVFYPGQSGLGIVVLLAVHHATGSFAASGAAGAAETLCFSCSSLMQGRWLDRASGPVLTGLCAAFVICTAATIAALDVGAGPDPLIALAGTIGLTLPGTGAAMRAVWSSRLPDGDARAPAFAFLTLAQDAGFMVGPAALGFLTTAVSAQVALGCAAALICAGSLMVVAAVRPGHADPAAETRPSGSDSGSGASRSPVRTIWPVALALSTVGTAFGAIDVSCAAFATEQHRPGLAGVLLAAVSVGSVTAGVWYGARVWRSAARTRLIACVGLLGVAGLGPALTPSLGVGAALLVLAGVAVGPTLTTAYLLAAELVPSERQTEAYSILSVAINAGAALGGVLGGALIAAGSAREGFLLAAVSPLVGVGLLVMSRRRRPRRPGVG